MPIMDKSLKTDLEQEQLKIKIKWLHTHYYITVGLAVIGFVLEIIIGKLMYTSGQISTTIPRYLMKYLILPTAVNTILIFSAFFVLHSKTISRILKTYIVSFTLVVICFVIFTIHSAFTALFFIFALPILLTAIYRQYRLSTLTSLFSTLALILSELFIKWDPDSSTVMDDGMRLGNFVISVVILLFFSIVSLIIIYFEKEKNQAVIQKDIERHKLQKRLEVDELTGIRNRIAFRNAISEMESNGTEIGYTFAMIDLDNFKQLNDNLGHVAGDRCLSGFGKILMNSSGDALAFRYGGDEFSLLFKNTSIEEVFDICTNIQKEFNTLAETFATPLPVSVSMGLAQYSGDMTPHDLIENSDIALYQSKKKKNMITIYKNSMEKAAEA